MDKWFINNKATIKGEKYCVQGYRLYNPDYYGEFGMWDTPDTIPLNKWRLEVLSWDNGEASWLSSKKMRMIFHNRDEANWVWKVLKDLEPDWSELTTMGFEEFA